MVRGRFEHQIKNITRSGKNVKMFGFSGKGTLMSIGQAYSDVLTPRVQEALEIGCNWLIDHCFENYHDSKNPEHFEDTVLGGHLPSRYLRRYSPLVYKQFAVCIITVAWKLAQPKHMPLSSVAEELAALAIINQTRALIEEDEDGQAIEEVLENFMDAYFELLFDNAYDGIDESEVGQSLGMSSLAFNNWFKPFTADSSRIAHPYVS